MSLPMERWSISVNKRTKDLDLILAGKFFPFTAKSRSERIRFLYDLAEKIFCTTPETLLAVVTALQRLNGTTYSHEFPAEVPIAGQGGSDRNGTPSDPLLLKFSRLRAASGRVWETVAWPLLSRERTHVIGRLA